MPEALPIRDDIAPGELRRRARREGNGRVVSRMLALAHAPEGMDRGQAARLAGMDRQTLRDWVIRFNALGVEGLRDRPKSGRRSWLDEGRLASLRALDQHRRELNEVGRSEPEPRPSWSGPLGPDRLGARD